MSKYAVIIPAMNEELSLHLVLHDLKQIQEQVFEVIVIDDGSTDATATIARECGATVLRHALNLGAWKATQTGMRYALKHGFTEVICMDADGQHKVADVHLLLNELYQGRDIVVGSCMSRGSAARHIAWRAFKLLTGLPISDITSGFRAYSANALSLLVSRQASMLEYQDVGVLMMMKQSGLSMSEVSVSMQERADGISRIFHSWVAVFKYLLYTFVLSLTKSLQLDRKSYRDRLKAAGKDD
jgi:glycosyltransferase involved in cell wall biosynthesis